jgi:hypothetical protein
MQISAALEVRCAPRQVRFFFSGTSARANPCDSLRGAWADNAEGSKDCELTINTECNRLKGDGFGGLLKVKYLVVLRL